MNCDLRHVTVVLCCDPKAFTHTNPLDGMSGGRLPGLGVGRRRRAGVGAAAAVGAQADHREEDPRLHAARVSRSRARRPTAATCSCACRATPSSARSSPSRRCSRNSASRQEQFRDVVHKQYVKKFGRLGEAVVNSNMEVMTQGFERVREIQIGELDARRSVHAARPGAAAGRSSRERQRRRLRLADADRTPMPEGQEERTPLTQHRVVRRGVPREPRLRPAGHAAAVARRHGRGQRRHRVQVRRPARNAALHSRELHAVHGVHRGLPGHRAAQLLAGSRARCSARPSPTT